MHADEDIRKALARAVSGRPVTFDPAQAEPLWTQAVANGLIGPLYSALERGSCNGPGPDFQSLLRREVRQLVARDLIQTQAAIRFVELLSQVGIDVLLLKGTALAHSVYEFSWHRPRTDVDAWIAGDQAEAAAAKLRDHGFTLLNVDHNTISSRQFQADTSTAGDTSVRFDVHLDISNRALFRHALEFETSLSRSVELPALRAKIPDRADRFLHGALHRVAQGRNTETHRLIWLYDLHLLHGAMDDAARQALVERALEARLGVLCAEALLAAHHYFDTPVRETDLEALVARRDEEPSAKLLEAGRWAWAWSDFMGQDSWADRGRFVRELLGNRVNG